MKAYSLLLILLLAGMSAAQTTPPRTSPAAPATVQTSNEYMKPIANAIAAKDWKTVATLAEQQLRQEPQRWQLYAPLGQAQLMLGNYDEALWSLALGIAGGQKEAAAATEPKRLAALNATLGELYVHQGNTYLKLRKNREAVAAYAQAAERDPNPARAYFNLCATTYNIGDTSGAIDFCTRAVAYDPAKADAYFVLGSCLFAQAEFKNGKYTVPAEGLEALRKYMELAPNGPHAADVKAMLEMVK